MSGAARTGKGRPFKPIKSVRRMGRPPVATQNLQNLVAQALHCHRAGDLARAEQLYGALLNFRWVIQQLG